ncbi:Nucleoporin-like protein amo1 OS=Schizosaccharomyces pombe (strain 972 / ATCC 24843) GN=amo1 PE=4 SV=1 [Rhizoctonia solani AG-1 IB]|uniref:Nucleoporin-like protein amo1 n=1 Tax=Thanatephorus cucumeris (strain AG1-IB / isolate 7/3/14) TaxID=1108050 RepID=A0A0B7FVH5_THACB|nr:Nucleoporin-like protein amo1 OS=Schizosaccharomyces pombe (strain 972 / ATCC 24843) GN=amo1 PE=4 SV=1 [Rhizoctonia solani AG-1 IB]
MSFASKQDTVCKFYLQGQCRFGASCRFAHPAGQGPSSGTGTGTFRNQTWTAKDAKPTLFDADSLRKDLTQGIDRPLYPLSSYGPGKCVPCIIDGLDESPEELRVAAWAATREAGGIESYKAREKQLIDAAQSLIGSAASTGAVTLDEAKRIWNVVDEQGNPPPNGQAEAKSKLRERLQPSTPNPVFGASTTPTSTFGTSAFGSSQPAQTSAFGGSSFVKPGTGAFGSTTGSGAFGGGGTTNAFGGSSQSQPSAFGGSTSQPSAFGAPAQTTSSAFGSSAGGTTFGQSGFGAKPAFGQSAFGSSTAATTTPAFGSSAPTAAFGQSGFGTAPAPAAPAFGQSGFGSKPAGSAFGSSAGGGSAFGAFANNSSSFGSTNTSNTTPAFGAPASSTPAFGSGGGTSSAFGSSGFGAFANKSASFGAQPNAGSAFGSSANNTSTGNLFVQTNTPNNTNGAEGMDSDTPTTTQAPTSAFGQPASSTTSAFGQTPATSAFGQTQPTSAFGSSAFGASSAFGTTPSTTSAFGATPATTSAFGNTSSAGTTSAFGAANKTSAFGAAAKPSAFGAASAFGSGSGFNTAFGEPKPKDRDPFAALLPDDYVKTLSEGIINAFKADKFELGSIPECVPPLEMR